ncbi:MAG: TIGR00296 family protein [Candidatus Hydrothermarchaeales archaeon]
MYAIEDGSFLITLARQTIERYLESGEFVSEPQDTPEKLREKAGVFVTLQTYPTKALRGCIGYPEPVLPLVEATIKAAISSATGDPRFPSLLRDELDKTLIEVSILTPSELIQVSSPKDYLTEIEIGKHGLIAEKGFNRGLLLPQVPVDEGWGIEEFLSHTCVKAGLLPDSWYDEDTKIHRFSGIVFSEVEPGGEVVERSLKER